MGWERQGRERISSRDAPAPAREAGDRLVSAMDSPGLPVTQRPPPPAWSGIDRPADLTTQRLGRSLRAAVGTQHLQEAESAGQSPPENIPGQKEPEIFAVSAASPQRGHASEAEGKPGTEENKTSNHTCPVSGILIHEVHPKTLRTKTTKAGQTQE